MIKKKMSEKEENKRYRGGKAERLRLVCGNKQPHKCKKYLLR